MSKNFSAEFRIKERKIGRKIAKTVTDLIKTNEEWRRNFENWYEETYGCKYEWKRGFNE